MFGAVCLTGTRTGRHVCVNCTYMQLLEAHNAVDSKLMTPFFLHVTAPTAVCQCSPIRHSALIVVAYDALAVAVTSGMIDLRHELLTVDALLCMLLYRLQNVFAGGL
jgi:hypothetical protein